MARYRSRSRSRSYSPRRHSRSPSPPRRNRYDDRSDSHRGGVGGYSRLDAPTGLLIRNISLDARPDDLRIPFERFGPVKDVYIPRNYYTREPRGFAFVKFRYAEDAALAKQEMNHQVIGGREISIAFAEENRKTPQEMRRRTRVSDRHMDGGYRRRSLSRSPRHQYHSYSRSPSPHRHNSRDRNRARDYRDDYYSPERSVSPARDNEKHNQASRRSPSPEGNGRGPYPSGQGSGHGRSPSRSRSYSPR